jgi:hypothetical protein
MTCKTFLPTVDRFFKGSVKFLRRCPPGVRESSQGSSISLRRRKFSEVVQLSGGIILGDLSIKNKELQPELKDDTDFFTLLFHAPFFYDISI